MPRFWVAELLQRALDSAVFAPEKPTEPPLGFKIPSPAADPQPSGTESTSQHTESCSTKKETANP